jgi:CheY-like chemotaxis protein
MAARSTPATTTSRVFRVLIVDDEEPVGLFIERVLRDPGYHTAVAADPDDAIRLATTDGPFDLLVTDLAMPNMHGDELARRLRAADPALKVLYVTRNGASVSKERAALTTGEALLDEPVTGPALLEAVGLMLEGRIREPRPDRVPVAGARVLFANQAADVVTLNINGTLVHGPDPVQVGTMWQLLLELPSTTVRATGRVVSSAPILAARPEGAPSPYATALAFVRLSARARRDLQRVCASAADPSLSG